MEKQTHTTEIPKWAALLVEAVNKPGLIMEAYSAFHNYSIGNQLLALIQCQMRGLQPGPINTFPKWQTLGRVVKRGERALMLCMPLTRKRRDQESDNNDATGEEHTYTTFVHRAKWFVVSQTVGSEIKAPEIPEWNADRALANLHVERIDFDSTDGNCQGFARKRQIAINPIAQLPFKTLFHEAAHYTCAEAHARQGSEHCHFILTTLACANALETVMTFSKSKSPSGNVSGVTFMAKRALQSESYF